MNTIDHKVQLVAEFGTHVSAEQAVLALTKAQFDVKDLSIVGLNYHTEEHPVGYVNTGDRMLTWGKYGAFWGTMWGILFGSAMVVVPGIGSLMLAGWLATTLAGAIEGAAVGAGIAALTAALTTIGIPKDSVLKYENAIKAGKFIVILRGTTEEVSRAKTILQPLGANNLEVSENRILTTA